MTNLGYDRKKAALMLETWQKGHEVGYEEGQYDACGGTGTVADLVAQARAEGRREGIEESARVADEEAQLSNESISHHTPFYVGGDGKREMEIGARSAARMISKRIRALATAPSQPLLGRTSHGH